MSQLVVSTSKALHERVHISDQEMATLVEQTFPGTEVASLSPLEYGYNNKIALVTLKGISSPSRCVLKISVAEDKYKKLEVESEVLDKLAKQQPHLPLPRVLHTDFSQISFSYPYAIYSYLPGTNLVKVIDGITPKSQVGKELAKALAGVHSLTFPQASFSLSETPSPKTWKETLQFKLEESLPYFEKSGSPYNSLVTDILTTRIAALAEPESFHLVHRDVQPQNLNWDVKTNRLAGLFDFETAMAGDPLYEFSLLERKLFHHYPEIKEAFYQTYTSLRPLPGDYQERAYFYLLTQLVYFYMRSVQKEEDDRLLAVKKEIEDLAQKMDLPK